MDKERYMQLLDIKAYEAVRAMMEATGEIIRKYHAATASTKHKRGVTTGQKAANSGIASTTKREKRAMLGMKTKRKKYGSVVPPKVQRKIDRAMAKRPE